MGRQTTAHRSRRHYATRNGYRGRAIGRVSGSSSSNTSGSAANAARWRRAAWPPDSRRGYGRLGAHPHAIAAPTLLSARLDPNISRRHVVRRPFLATLRCGNNNTLQQQPDSTVVANITPGLGVGHPVPQTHWAPSRRRSSPPGGGLHCTQLIPCTFARGHTENLRSTPVGDLTARSCKACHDRLPGYGPDRRTSTHTQHHQLLPQRAAVTIFTAASGSVTRCR